MYSLRILIVIVGMKPDVLLRLSGFLQLTIRDFTLLKLKILILCY